MANRKGKIGRFTPYVEKESEDREKVKLDIEILKSIRYKFKSNNELVFHFDKIINKLKKL